MEKSREQAQMDQIPEIDVLIATARWLKDREAFPIKFSVASGRGIKKYADTARLRKELSAAGQENFLTAATGPDVIAFSETEFWQVECKGAGKGVKTTQRSNFDRALASTVSYFTADPADEKNLSDGLRNALRVITKGEPKLQFRLGLALPETPAYLSELRRRVGKPLRKQLDLWILLLNLQDRSIRAVPPEEDV